MTEPQSPRPWWRKLRPSLSLRMLMAFVLAIGVGLGWVVHRARLQRQAVEAITKAGGRVFYDWQVPGDKLAPPNAASLWPKRLVDALGPDYFDDVTWVLCIRHTDPILMAMLRSPRTNPCVPRVHCYGQTWWQTTRPRQGEILAADDPGSAAERAVRP